MKTASNISQKSSPEFTIDVSPPNRINETSILDIHTPLVASVTNENSTLTQKNSLKIEAQLSVLRSYVNYKLSALTSKIDVFSDSIKKALSDLQNKEHKNSQIEVLKKNITLLQNEIKSKDTIIESLLETQKTLTKYLSDQIPKPFQSIENHCQQQLRLHQDHYQHHSQHQQQYPQSQAKQSSPFRRNYPLHQNKVNTLWLGNLSDLTTVRDLYELFGLSSTQYLSENSGIQMPLRGNAGKRRGFAYIIKVPEFNGRKLVMEKTKHYLRKLPEKTSKLFYKRSHRQ